MSKLENALCQDQSLPSLKKNGSSSNDRRGSFEGSHRGSNQPNYSLSNGNSRFENDESMSYEKNIYGGKNVDFMHSIQESEEFLVKGSQTSAIPAKDERESEKKLKINQNKQVLISNKIERFDSPQK